MTKLHGMVLALLGLAGCGAADPCSDQSGICVALKVTGEVGELTQLSVRVKELDKTMTSTPGGGFTLPVQVALQLPSTLQGTATLLVDGLSPTGVVAHGETAVTLPATGRVAATVPLSKVGGGVDLGGDGGDGMLPGITLKVQGETTVYELDVMHLEITGTDPAGGAVRVMLSGAPTGATVSAGAASKGTLDWTPSITQAGPYALQVQIDADLPGLSGTQTVPLTVLNKYDVVPSTLPRAIGDFDKDGYGDLATCQISQTLSAFKLTIIYGAETGISASSPTKTYLFKTSDFSPTLTLLGDLSNGPCLGGDFNHDGYADVALGDSTANNPAGFMFVAMGTDRNGSPKTAVLQPYDPTQQKNFGAELFAGDLNDDGVTDLVETFSNNTPTSNATDLWVGPLFPNAGAIPAKATNSGDKYCGLTHGRAVGNVNGDTAADFMFWDLDVGAATTTQCTNGTLRGGLRIVLGDKGGAFGGRVTVQYMAGTGFSDETLCDVDGDGWDDLVVRLGGGNPAYYLNNKTSIPFPAVLDPSAAQTITAPVGAIYTAEPVCLRNFIGGKSALLLQRVSQQINDLDGFDVYVAGALSTPITFLSPTPTAPTFNGNALRPWGGMADVNGDGKQDFVALASGGALVVYGR